MLPATKIDLTASRIGKYMVSNRLQLGGQSKVYLGFVIDEEQKKGEEKVAIKHQRGKINSEQEAKINNEEEFYRTVKHPGICEIREIIVRQEKDIIDQYLILEYCPTDFFLLRERGILLESVLDYLLQISEILSFIHQQGIIYRDLKLENLLLSTEGKVKLCDFGSISWPHKPYRAADFAGTTEYLPPEMILWHTNSYAHDIWSFGILIYEMLFQRSPFFDTSEERIVDNILAGKWNIPHSKVPKEYLTLIEGCLQACPTQRLGWTEIRKSLLELKDKKVDNLENE